MEFFAYADDNCAPISFNSYKLRRITRSSVAGEGLELRGLFDAAVSLSNELAIFMQKTVPMQLLADNKSIFGVISRGS